MGIFSNKAEKKSKIATGIFVSPKGILEVVQFDLETKKVLKSGNTELSYDLVARQINSLDSFELSLQKLYNELHIQANTPAVLTLPTILMNHHSLPASLGDMEIGIALTSEAERNYIFKRHEPSVSWEVLSKDEEANTAHLIYTATKKEEISQISSIFQNLGYKLAAIDTSYASLIRGLALTGVVESDVAEGTLWSILLITSNSFVIITLMGNKIIEVQEDPLAIKSFNPEDIYPTIASYSLEGILNKNPDHVVIVSETNDVSAEVLSTYFDLNCKVTYVELNKFAKAPLFEGNYANDSAATEVSLEAVGAVAWKNTDIPVSFNFKENDDSELEGGLFELNSQVLQYIIIGLIGLSVISMAVVYMFCSSMVGAMDKTLADLGTEKTQIQSQIDAQQSPNIDNIPELLASVYDKNGKILQSFNSIGAVVPEKLWIEKFTLNDSLAPLISGRAYSVEDIITYYQNLNKTAKFENFKITSIKEISTADTAKSANDNGSGVSIVPATGISSESGLPGLPGLPNFPAIGSPKLYEFSFGAASASVSSSPMTNSPAPASAGISESPFAAAPAKK